MGKGDAHCWNEDKSDMRCTFKGLMSRVL